MRIQVLGNVAAFSDSGEELLLGGPKQRTVLAMLCQTPGVTVSTDALAAAVWGDEVPERFARSLSTYISNLRRSLGDVVVSRQGGYAIEADPGMIDAADAEAAISEGEYGAALQMWKGQPYGDVDGYGAFRTEMERLGELRLVAGRSVVGESVEAGDHAAALQLLGPLLADHPLDEVLIGLKMEALYGSGRQAEALEAFGKYRDLLMEDLGLDPSPALISLELRILQHDATLSPAPAAAAGPVVPVGLPLRYSSFLGREIEMDSLARALSSGRLVTVAGPGGMGKSSVAIETARTLDSIPIAYLKLEPVAPDYVATALAESIGLQPASGAESKKVCADYLASYPHLLLLDGCEAHLDEVRAIVDLILSTTESRILATSRRRLGLPGEAVIRLGELSSDAALDLFFERSFGLERNEASIQSVSLICAALDGMPLAIELAAARTSSIPLDRIRDRLADQNRLLSSGSPGEGRHSSISTAIEWSYNLLDESGRQTLVLLSQFSAPFSIEEAATFTGDQYVDDAISALVDGSLIQPPDEHGRYRVLEPIRQFAFSRIQDEEKGALRLRYVRWLARESERQYRTFRFERDERRYFAWLRRMAGAIASALSWSQQHEHTVVSQRLVAACGRFWPSVLDPSLLSEHALAAIDEEPVTHDSVYQIALAHTYWLTRNLDSTVAAELLDRVEEELMSADEPTARQALLDAAIGAHLTTGALSKEAGDRLDRVYAVYREVTRDIGEPLVYSAYTEALISLLRGLRDRAIELLDHAIRELEDSDTVCVAPHLNLKGVILEEEGDLDGALQTVTEAARIAAEWDRPHYQTLCERHLLTFSLHLNDPEQALIHLERHDEAMRRIGLPPAEVFTPDTVARLRAQTGDWHDFPTLVRRYLDLAPDRSTPAWRAWLAGDGSAAAGIAVMIHPVASWALARGRTDDAQALVGSASWAYADGAPWQEMGEVARIDALRAQLDTGSPAVRSPQSLDDLHDLIRGLVTLCDY